MTAGDPAPSDSWSAARYAEHAGFVPELGGEILAWLSPRPGERILDLGCGDGRLTRAIAESGAEVVGVDASADMVAAARASGVDARLGRGEALAFCNEFDAVFSNAALHWMREPDLVAKGVARALRRGGRFVAEMGGHGNVAAIATALRAGFRAVGLPDIPQLPWYFPTEAEYRQVLEGAGFEVIRSQLAARPTMLPTNMEGWLETFVVPYFVEFEGPRGKRLTDELIDLLRPSLRDRSGQWTADYVRLRVEARLAV